MDKLKLTIELVPQTCWFSNLRKVLTTSEWDRVRKYTYSLSEDRSCMICGTHEGRLSAHEIWEYDMQTHTQKLIGLIALCDDCHMVKHIGLAQIQGKFILAQNHFCKVNQCDGVVLDEAMQEAYEMYHIRSDIDDWKLDISYLKEIGFDDIYNKYKNAYEPEHIDFDEFGIPVSSQSLLKKRRF